MNQEIEKDKKQKLFQERSLQISEYKKYYKADTDLILTTETDTLKFNMLLQELIYRQGQDVIRQNEIKKQNEALRKQNEKNAEQIKRLKKEIKQTPIAKPIPTPASAFPNQTTTISREVADADSFGVDSFKDNSEINYVETQNENIIMVNRLEYELLRKRYGIAKTALESVLYFIVPQNLRDLVNKAMKEIAEAK